MTNGGGRGGEGSGEGDDVVRPRSIQSTQAKETLTARLLDKLARHGTASEHEIDDVCGGAGSGVCGSKSYGAREREERLGFGRGGSRGTCGSPGRWWMPDTWPAPW